MVRDEVYRCPAHDFARIEPDMDHPPLRRTEYGTVYHIPSADDAVTARCGADLTRHARRHGKLPTWCRVCES